MTYRPPMFQVKSLSISHIGYESSALYVRFADGGLFRYDGVPFSLFTGLRLARVMGHYLQIHILANYHGEHVPEEESI